MNIVSSYTQQNFITDFADTSLKVDDELLQKVDQALGDIGESTAKRTMVRDELIKLAGSDGIISGHEMNALFGVVDAFDQNGSNTSFNMSKVDKSGHSVTTLSGALTNTLLAARLKGETITAGSMADKYSQATINIQAVTDADFSQLAELGLSKEVLQKCQDADGQISGKECFNKLFAQLDEIDDFGEGIVATKIANSSSDDLQDTKAGKALSILDSYATHALTLSRASFVSSHISGQFDLGKLSDGDKKELAEIGISAEQLNYYAKQNGGSIKGETAITALYSALDALDDYKGSDDIRLTGPLPMDIQTASNDQLTKTGRALNILSKCYVASHAQVYRSYTDLSRAAMEQEPARAPIELNVPCYCQGSDSTGCLRTCRRMLKAFDAKIDAKVCQAGGSAHYMAQAENTQGAIKGAAEPLQAGGQYIDYCLEHGRPVIIGISDRDQNYNTDKITDHFIIIVGRKTDAEGHTVYIYNDPATQGPEKTGPLYVDNESGMLFRPEFARSQGSKVTRQYQVAQIRPYTDADFNFQKVTGSKINPPPTGK